MKKILILLTVACVLFISACDLNTLGNQDEGTSTTDKSTSSVSESASDPQTPDIWRGDVENIIDTNRQSFPSTSDAQQLVMHMKLKTALNIMGKAHDTAGPPYSYVYAPIIFCWYLGDGTVVKATFVYHPDSIDKAEGLSLWEEWVNYGYLVSRSIDDVDTNSETTTPETTVEDTTQLEYVTILSPDDFFDHETKSMPSDDEVKQIEA